MDEGFIDDTDPSGMSDADFGKVGADGGRCIASAECDLA
jgi:hypothetical protein